MIINNEFLTEPTIKTYGKYRKTTQPQEPIQASGSFLDEVSLQQYKQYIYDKISQIPVHPSQRLNSIAVHISDSGFEAMKNDPEYEKWVLDTLTYNFGFHDPWANLCGGSYAVHTFGATKEEYHGEGWFKGYQGGRGQNLFDEKAEDSFWERRLRHKKLMKEQRERWREKKWMEDQRLQKMYEQEMINRSLEERNRIAGKDYYAREPRLPVFTTSFQTSQLIDMLLS